MMESHYNHNEVNDNNDFIMVMGIITAIVMMLNVYHCVLNNILIVYSSGDANYSFAACMNHVRSLVKPVDRQGMFTVSHILTEVAFVNWYAKKLDLSTEIFHMLDNIFGDNTYLPL